MSRTILLADDSVTIQKVIELTFMEQDYDVMAVSDGDEALDKLGGVSPDIVIADVHMPGASGLDVCRRAKELHPRVPVLLLVGTFEPFDVAEADAAGADAHLKKPFDSQELLQLVGELMGREGAVPVPTEAADPGDLESASQPETAAAEAAGEDGSAGGWGFDAPATAPSGAETVKTDLGDLSWGESGQVEVDAPAVASQQEEPAPVSGAPDEAEAAQAVEHPSAAEAVAAEAVAAEAEAVAAEAVAAAEPAESDWGFRMAQSVEAGDDPPIEAPADTALATEADDPPEEGAAAFSAADDLDSYSSADIDAAAYGGEAPAADPAPASASLGAVSGLSNEDVDRIARRVTELLGDQVAREVAWEVVPDLAEVVIRERLRELEGQLD